MMVTHLNKLDHTNQNVKTMMVKIDKQAVNYFKSFLDASLSQFRRLDDSEFCCLLSPSDFDIVVHTVIFPINNGKGCKPNI